MNDLEAKVDYSLEERLNLRRVELYPPSLRGSEILIQRFSSTLAPIPISESLEVLRG